MFNWGLKNVGFTPNPQQEQAIHHIEGPLHLPAGPGSGKTRVLLWRTVNLIVFHGVSPDEIFLSTLYRFRGATMENFVEFPARCQR